MAEKARKRRKLPRRGTLAEANQMLRAMTAVVLVMACAALAFTQLGFAGLGAVDNYQAYVVLELLPVALAALLLGALRGAAMGAAGGAMLYAHAVLMPLDYYEFTYVTPFSSVFLLTVSGWLLGLLFAFALRNDPPPVKRVIYVFLACFAVSLLYSLGFAATVIIDVAKDLIENHVNVTTESEMQMAVARSAGTMVLRMGDVGMQVWVDAALMAFFCCLADFGARHMRKRAGNVGLRMLFASWLAVVVMLAFMITAGGSFTAITQGLQDEASNRLESETGYLCEQIRKQSERFNALETFVNQSEIATEKIGENAFTALTDSVSVSSLLDGYSEKDDGAIVIAFMDDLAENPLADAKVAASDSDRFVNGHDLDEYFDAEALAGAKKSLDEGKVERIVFDEVSVLKENFGEFDPGGVKSYVTYILCKRQEDALVLMMMPASSVFVGRGATMGWTTAVSLALLLAVFLVVSQLLGRLVVNRIDKTNEALGRIMEGDLEAQVEEHGTREFKSLSNGINATVDALKGWIAEAETRIDAELATAKAIQESALPRTFPPYPDIPRFDIYASMTPAREVGGDFYDFFLIGDEANADAGKLGFVIADVSGKGVPAALFMMKSMTQIRDYLKSGMAIGEAVENANRQLVDGNDAGMFVTAWIGVLDYGSGHVEYVNAGHNPPLLWQGGKWRWLEEKSGLPLGLFDGFPYDAFSVDCEIGDQFLLYTDGVTEAMSASNELYGEERLMALANENFTLHPRRLVGTVRRSVSKHAEGAEQSDDITILALEVGVPPEVTATLIVPAEVDELPHVNEFIHTELDRRLCPLRVQNQIDIAVEELFVNVAHYAYPDAAPDNPGTVRVSYTYSAEPPSVVISIADEGIPYNPLEKPDAVTPDDIMDVPIGGLGILMAKKSVDEMIYVRENASNVLTIKKKW